MPGHVDLIAADTVQGWARHPVYADYPMTVHLLCDGRIAVSTLAETVRTDQMPGFALARPAWTQAGRLAVMLGETGEMLLSPPKPPARMRVEDLLAITSPSTWRTGACARDAAGWGFCLETQIELICQDFLAGALTGELARAAVTAARRGGTDAVRSLLLNAPAYRHRLIYADQAPGAIFSRFLVHQSASGDKPTLRLGTASAREVPATELLALDGVAFITACYRRLLLKEPDPEGMAHYQARLRRGDAKIEIIRFIGNELESIRAGIVVVDLPENE